MLQRLLHIVSGIVLLVVAHIFGTLLKSYIYKYGREEVHVERKKGETQLTSTQSSIQEQKTRLPFIIIGQFAYYTVIIIAVMMVLRLLGVETTGLLALIGAAGFAIGLALPRVKPAGGLRGATLAANPACLPCSAQKPWGSAGYRRSL